MWPLRLQVLSHIIMQLYSMQITEAHFDSGQHQAEHIKQSAQFDYLNRKRPLWVLEDEVQSVEREVDHVTFTTTERPSYSKYYFKYRQNKMKPEVGFYRKSSRPKPTKSIEHLYLPKNYLYAERYKYETSEPTSWRRQQPASIPLPRDDFTPSMPIFDSTPTDIDTSSGSDDEMLAPIFVYNGPKGELIMNTMLSARKYPMQEPVPGQILYPPTEPIFRPKPIVKSFHVPGRPEPLNLTLIPFYAHEAIVPRYMFDSYSTAATAASSLEAVEPTTAAAATARATATRSPPAVFYAAAAPTPPRTTSATTTIPKSKSKSNANAKSLSLSKKRRHKKAKKYAVYRSADEVHWRPTESSMPSASTATTSFPMVLASPLQNHRFNLIDDGYYGYDVTTEAPVTSTTTTAQPMKNFQLTYKDEDSQFQIVYVDESLEKPTTNQVLPTKAAATRVHRVSTPKPLPLLSSHYSADKEYYAFPVYTLGKLLRPDNAEKPFKGHAAHSAAYRKQPSKDPDTWFIMNSRYKGQRSNSNPKKLSSKYVETGPAYSTQSAEDLAETTIEKAIT